MTAMSLCFMFSAVSLVLLHSSSASRVIFMPFPITSQAYIHVQMARAMLDRGHQVWLVVPDIMVDKNVLNTTGISVIQFHTGYSIEDDIVDELFLKSYLAEESMPFSVLCERYHVIAHNILSNEKLFQQMKAVHADLFVFDDNGFIAKMFVVFPYRLEIPFACVDFSFEPFDRRTAFSPATVPAFRSELNQHMTLPERLKNTLLFLFQLMYRPPWHYEDVVARYAPEMPYVSLDRLVARAELWLVHLDPVVFYPYPTLPNVKYIGSMAAAPPDPLESRFQSFMDNAKDGAVVVTFGSMVKNMPQNITDKLISAFLKLRPLKVVFRFDVTSPDPEQIMTSSWLPQNALLAHRNCRVFVTHCGKSGVYQGVYHGVPMLGLPLFFDQHENAHIMQAKGFGTTRDIRKISDQELADTIKHLIEDPHYKQNITKASTLFRELNGVPVKSAAYWLDHVMKYGGDYMRSSGQEMPLYQFLLLDVLGIIGGTVVVLLMLLICCLKYLCRRFCKTKFKRE
ncbi:UDP-glucuronosyltransferase 2B33-like [Littorina saxatilis]|uniref:UDP-glucuronosyltransferase n=1 Tax=Littorina saxatilis TaxID=31220 RepID=A0AAN9AZ14_9CAEN